MGVLIELILSIQKVILLQESHHIETPGEFIREFPRRKANRSSSRKHVCSCTLKVDKVFPKALDTVLTAQKITHCYSSHYLIEK